MRRKKDPMAETKSAVTAMLAEGIKKFKKYLGDAVEAILKAGRQFAEDLERFPKDAPSAYKTAFPNVTDKSWELLRRIGNGDLVPTAFFIERDSTISLVSRLPYRTQVILLGDVDTPATPQNVWDGRREKVKLVKEMTRVEVQRLIDVGTCKIRPIAEQKHYCPVEIVEGVESEATAPYTVLGNVVKIKRKCEIGLNELARIAKKLGLKLVEK